MCGSLPKFIVIVTRLLEIYYSEHSVNIRHIFVNNKYIINDLTFLSTNYIDNLIYIYIYISMSIAPFLMSKLVAQETKVFVSFVPQVKHSSSDDAISSFLDFLAAQVHNSWEVHLSSKPSIMLVFTILIPQMCEM